MAGLSGEPLGPGMQMAYGLGGGLSPGHFVRNSFWRSGVTGNTNDPAYSNIAGTQAYSYARHNASEMPKPRLAASPTGSSRELLGLLKGLVSGLGGASAGGKVSAQFSGQRGPGAIDQTPHFIGPQASTPVLQEFLPEWLTTQTGHDIQAQGSQKFNPYTALTKRVGNFGIGANSGTALAKVARQHAMGMGETARVGAETGFSDELARQQFAIRHALARHQDVSQGARNQALRDAITQRGGQSTFNMLLSLLSDLG